MDSCETAWTSWPRRAWVPATLVIAEATELGEVACVLSENVGEKTIVEDAKAAANYRLAVSQQSLPETRRVGKAEARPPVLLVSPLLDDAVVAGQVVVVDRRVLQLVGRAPVVLIAQAEVHAQVRPRLPGVLEEVVLRGKAGVDDRAAEGLAHRGRFRRNSRPGNCPEPGSRRPAA